MSAAWHRQRRGPSPGARRSVSQLWRVHLCVLWSRVGAPGAVALPVVWTALVAAPRNGVSQVLLQLVWGLRSSGASWATTPTTLSTFSPSRASATGCRRGRSRERSRPRLPEVLICDRTCINFAGDSISSSVSPGFGRTNAGETPALLNMVKQPHLQNCYRLFATCRVASARNAGLDFV